MNSHGVGPPYPPVVAIAAPGFNRRYGRAEDEPVEWWVTGDADSAQATVIVPGSLVRSPNGEIGLGLDRDNTITVFSEGLGDGTIDVGIVREGANWAHLLCTCTPEWPEPTPVMVECAELVHRLYQLPGCGVGGPLHIVTDDENIDDDHLAFCWESVYDKPAVASRDELDGPSTIDTNVRYRAWWRLDQITEETDLMVRVASAILWGLGSMNEAERALVVAQTYREPDSFKWVPSFAGQLAPHQDIQFVQWPDPDGDVPGWVCDQCRTDWGLPERRGEP